MKQQLEHFLKNKTWLCGHETIFKQRILQMCFYDGVAYFDLTEDVEVTDYIKNLNTKLYDAQCGCTSS